VKNKILKYVFASVIILVVGGALYFKFVKGAEQESPLDLYATSEVTTGVVNIKVSGKGKVSVKDKVSVFIDATQKVSKVYPKVGDYVNAGDVLIEYDIEQDLQDLNRKLLDANISLETAKINLKDITEPASGNELLQYNDEIVNVQNNILDAENEIINIQNSKEDIKNDIASLDIKVSQQEIKVNDARKEVSDNEILFQNGAIARRVYENSLTALELAEKSLESLAAQKEVKVKNLETKNTQEKYAEDKLQLRKEQEKNAETKLANSQDRFTESGTENLYNIQQNIIKSTELDIIQIQADIKKLVSQTTSPISGIITEVNVKDGGLFSKGVAGIVISDKSETIGTLDVNEYDAPLIIMGQKVLMTTSGLPDMIYEGVISKISDEATEKDDSSDEVVVPVEISIDNMDERLKIGYSMDMEIIIEEKIGVISIPIEALITEDEKYFVYVIENDVVVKKEITIGLYGDKAVEVVGGLKEKEILILSPSEVIEDGRK